MTMLSWIKDAFAESGTLLFLIQIKLTVDGDTNNSKQKLGGNEGRNPLVETYLPRLPRPKRRFVPT